MLDDMLFELIFQVLTALTVALIYLKVVGLIEWSWIWVLSPIWIPILFVIGYLFKEGDDI